jgi:hypothetical protein
MNLLIGQLGWLLEGRDNADQQHAKQAFLTTLLQHATEHGVEYPCRAGSSRRHA